MISGQGARVADWKAAGCSEAATHFMGVRIPPLALASNSFKLKGSGTRLISNALYNPLIKMVVKCEKFVKDALPATRSMLARKMLYEKGMTQMQVASVLGVSQASISQYLSAKRGNAFLRQLSSDPLIKTSIEELLTNLLDSRGSADQKQEAFCDFCEVVNRRLRRSSRKKG